MTLQQVGALVQQLLVTLASLVSPLAYITARLKLTAVEHGPYLIENRVSSTLTEVGSIQADTTAIIASLGAISTMIVALGSPQQSTSPVVLPAAFPGGWDAGLQADAQTGVWSQLDAYTGATTLGDLSNLALVAGNMGQFHTNPGNNDRPFHWIDNLFQSVPYPIARSFGAEFPQNSILPSDTLLTFLNTANPGWTWTWDDPGHNWATATDPANGTTQWYCDVDASAFAAMQAGSLTVANLPPVWPGSAGVTIGASVPLSDGLVVAGPLAGLLIDITAVAPPVSFYPFGAIKSFVRAGAVVFTTDAGDSEFPQPFGPEDEIILPKAMTVADSATLRVTTGIVGTVRPFTVP